MHNTSLNNKVHFNNKMKNRKEIYEADKAAQQNDIL